MSFQSNNSMIADTTMSDFCTTNCMSKYFVVMVKLHNIEARFNLLALQIELMWLIPFLYTAHLIKRKTDEESDSVDQDDEATAQSIHTNTPVNVHDPREGVDNLPVRLEMRNIL